MDIMNEHDEVILINPYDDLAAARKDFTMLRSEVHRGRIELREAVLVARDDDGRPTVVEISKGHVRSGAGFGAGLGLLAGLLVPALVASVAVGAAAGALAAKFADHGMKSGLKHEVGEALERNTGVVLIMARPAVFSTVSQVLSSALAGTTVEFAGATIANLEAAITAAMADVGASPD